MSTSKPPNLDLFGEPDINFAPQSLPAVKEKRAKRQIVKKTEVEKQVKPVRPKKTASSKKSAPAEPEKNINQAFLPGLSRRGRPRSKDPISAVERTAKHRRERLDAGAKRVEVILAPEVTRKLEALAQQQKEPKSEVISNLINKAYSRMSKTKSATTTPVSNTTD